jgi:hypothetical protein
MQDAEILLLSDSPDFLTGLEALNSSILRKAHADDGGDDDDDEKEAELSNIIREVSEKRKSGFLARLKTLNMLRSLAWERAAEEAGYIPNAGSRSGTSSGGN